MHKLHFSPVPAYSVGRASKRSPDLEVHPGPADYDLKWNRLYRMKKAPAAIIPVGDLNQSVHMLEENSTNGNISLGQITRKAISQITKTKSTIFDVPKFVLPGPGQYEVEKITIPKAKFVSKFSVVPREVSTILHKTTRPGPGTYELYNSALNSSGIARLPDLKPRKPEAPSPGPADYEPFKSSLTKKGLSRMSDVPRDIAPQTGSLPRLVDHTGSHSTLFSKKGSQVAVRSIPKYADLERSRSLTEVERPLQRDYQHPNRLVSRQNSRPTEIFARSRKHVSSFQETESTPGSGQYTTERRVNRQQREGGLIRDPRQQLQSPVYYTPGVGQYNVDYELKHSPAALIPKSVPKPQISDSPGPGYYSIKRGFPAPIPEYRKANKARKQLLEESNSRRPRNNNQSGYTQSVRRN